MSVDLERDVRAYAEYLDEVLPTITADDIATDTTGLVRGVPVTRRRRAVLVAAAAAVVTLMLIGGAVVALRPSSRPGSPATVPQPDPTAAPQAPTPTVTAPATPVTSQDSPPPSVTGYDPDAALAQVAAFHSAWNAFTATTIVEMLHPDSTHREDLNLIRIAVAGFRATVDAECSPTPGADPESVNVTCVETVEDDFYTAAGIRLTTEVTYLVTADGIDILEGDPIWAIPPTGIALEFLEDFDAELGRVNGVMVTIPGWISLNPSVSPNWGTAQPRAYSVESVRDAELAVLFLTSEFLHREGDRWEPLTVDGPVDVIPEPQTEVSACPMPTELPSGNPVEPWLVELHAAVGLLVQHTNALGDSLTETEDFTEGWDRREPVAAALAFVIADLDSIDAIGAELTTEFELFDGITHYRDAVLPAFFEMRSQGTAIAYFNSGGKTQGPCGAAATAVLMINTMLGIE